MTTSMQNNPKHQSKQWSKAGLLYWQSAQPYCLAVSLGLGSSEYGCPGMPEGVRCLSAREVYELTSNGAAPKTIDAVVTRIGSPLGIHILI